jgi:hypothetical protein
MRFAVPSASRELQALVVALDRPDEPMAATWRAVGEAAWKLGLTRPGYHVVRELALAVRARRESRSQRRRAVLEVLASVPSPYVVDLRRALNRLLEVERRERLVLEQHKPP